MRDLLQDVHFPLDLLSPYTTSADATLTLLDEFGRIFDACSSLFTAFDDRKLPTVDTKEECCLGSRFKIEEQFLNQSLKK